MASLAHARGNWFAKEERMAHMAMARLWTVDDVHALPDDGNRYEVIDGELLVTPAPSMDHQRLVFLLATVLRDFLEQNPIPSARSSFRRPTSSFRSAVASSPMCSWYPS